MLETLGIAEKIIQNVEKVIVGKRGEVVNLLISLLCEGHVLVEDVPGVGKTMLARSIAQSIGCKFSRIQFTPDMLPSDIIGVNVFNQKSREFEFKAGPIHSQIILADEINRATPKTQSALLECMEERQVTVDGVTYTLPRPFMVVATQNPIEYEGTFPLPESQMDRFFMRIKLGYPDAKSESEILDRQKLKHPIEDLEPVVSAQEILNMQKQVKNIFVKEEIRDYIVSIVQSTRNEERIFLGASPRGSLALYRASQAKAFLDGRDYVIPDDVKEMAILTLSHRIITHSEDIRINSSSEEILREILEEVPIP